MTYACSRCGEEWERHPVTRVPCPACPAEAGQWCVRPSGHQAAELHAAREQAALDAGELAPCPQAPESAPPCPTKAEQMELF